MCRCTMYIQLGNVHTTRKSQFLIFSGNFGSFELKRIVVCRKFFDIMIFWELCPFIKSLPFIKCSIGGELGVFGVRACSLIFTLNKVYKK